MPRRLSSLLVVVTCAVGLLLKFVISLLDAVKMPSRGFPKVRNIVGACVVRLPLAAQPIDGHRGRAFATFATGPGAIQSVSKRGCLAVSERDGEILAQGLPDGFEINSGLSLSPFRLARLACSQGETNCFCLRGD